MISFSSCGYLDVSVPRVRPQPPMRSAVGDGCCEHPPGFPIRTPPDQSSFASSPGLFAGCRVLRRLSMPRHPPYTLNRLTTFIDHRLVPPRQNTKGRRAASTTRLAEKVPDDTRPTERQTLLAPPVGITRGAVQGRASRIVSATPPGRLKPGAAADYLLP